MQIGTRTLIVDTDSGPREVAIRLHSPEESDGKWLCHYEIGWPEGPRKSLAMGQDSLEALHLALQKVGVDLYMSRHHHEGKLRWTTPWEGYGFPVPKNGRDILIGHDREFFG